MVDYIIIECKNGEFINTKTGDVLGYADFEMFPPLSEDGKNLMRHFDGVSAEPLGNIPKIIAISNEEIRLLRQLRPWDMLKYEFRSDYRKLITKINKQQQSIRKSVIMKNRWRDPVYRAEQMQPKGPNPLISVIMLERWRDPQFRDNIVQQIRERTNTDKWRSFVSKHFTKMWAEPAYRLRLSPAIREGQEKRYFKTGAREVCVAQAKKAWVTRRQRYGENGFSDKQRKIRFKTDKDKMRSGERVRWGYAWKRLDEMFSMLFDSP